MLSRLLRTRSIEQLRASSEVEGHRLKKNLSAVDLTMLGVGAIIGAGIFSTIGTAAAGNLADGRPAAGPALMLSFVLTGLACGFTALCYAEMAAMIPVSGSAYTYAYATLGELAAWILGWDLVLEYAVSNVAVAISWGDYARSFLAGLGLIIPPVLAMDPRTALTLSGDFLKTVADPSLGDKLGLLARAKAGEVDGALVFANWDVLSHAPLVAGFPVTVNLLAVVVTVLVTWVCFLGIRESARTNTVMVIIKLAILLVVIVMGAAYVSPGNWTPFAPNGLAGIQAGAAIIFFAYIGFDAISTTAEECKEPSRDMPRGILWSLAICTVVYILVTVVVTGMVHYAELEGRADPLAYVFERHNLTWLAGIISFGAVIATTASLLVYQLGQPRIMMSMSRDGLVGPWFGRVHPRHGTPGNATVLTGFLVAVPAALMNIGEVVELANIGTLFAFSVVCVGVMVLRVKRPEVPRRFKVPLVWVVGPAGVLACGWLAWGLPALTFVRFFVWLALGLVIYAVYGYRRSRLAEAAAPSAP
jgi:APA family basic amino acid/polyamine antiporter